jgi:hypothetical protein
MICFFHSLFSDRLNGRAKGSDVTQRNAAGRRKNVTASFPVVHREFLAKLFIVCCAREDGKINWKVQVVIFENDNQDLCGYGLMCL